jgi:hypothetical protein
MLRHISLWYKGKWNLLFPALFAVYPILFFYNHNIQQSSFSDILLPVFLSLTITFLGWSTFRFFLKDALSAGLAISFGLFIFFGYGHLIDFLENRSLTFPLHRHYQILFTLLCLWGYFSWMIRKKSPVLAGTAKFLTILSCLLIMPNLVSIIEYHWQMLIRRDYFHTDLLPLTEWASLQPTSDRRPKTISMPDIYLIVLDGYAASSTAREILSFDNSPFESRLRNYGFRIAKNTTTHSKDTAVVMASLLNMEKLETPPPEMEGPIFERIRTNRVFSTLHSLGYQTVHFPILSYASLVTPMRHADREVIPQQILGSHHLDDFRYELIKTTLCRPLLKGFYTDGTNSLSALYTNYIFQQLEGMPRQKGPKFVYAHIPCPHAPFVFDEAGNSIGYQRVGNEQYYLGQYKYVSRKTLAVMDAILGQSENPPIVILLSDHGPRGESANSIGSRDEHWQRIFFAALIPDEKIRVKITDTFPVLQTFRLLFDDYFPKNGISTRKSL